MSEANADVTNRIVIKVGTGIATAPPSNDHRNGDWISTDIYDAELYLNDADGKLYTANGGVVQSIISPFSIGDLTDVDLTGLNTSDILQYDGADFVPIALPSSSNLGNADLTSTANSRVYTLNGSTSSNLLTIDTGAGTDIIQFRGDNTAYMPAGHMSIGTTPNSTVRLKLQSDSYGVYSSSMTLADYYASSAANKNFHAENSKAGGIGIYANMTATTGVNYGIYGRAIASGSGTNVGIRAAALNATTNYAIYIDGGNIHLDDTTDGCKIGTTTSQKIGLWNTTPVIQPTTGITAGAFTANTSGIADDTATFDGYTIGQIAAALRQIGILA